MALRDTDAMAAAQVATAQTFLFVPGDRPERFEKARASGADLIIFDLEDAVAPDAKSHARAEVASALDPQRPAIVRINGVGSPWFEGDLDLCRARGVLAVMLPKAEPGAHLAQAAAAGPIVALVETAVGILEVRSVAAQPGVIRLAIGEVDLALDLGLAEPEAHLGPHRAAVVLASRVAGLTAPIAGVTTGFDDESLVVAEASRARGGGFGAKLCIHPAQLMAARAGLRPGRSEIAWAQRVFAAAAAADGAAVAVGGQMVDGPVLERARRVLAVAERGGA